MTNLTDTDRTNIYSYRGTDFTGDLQTYLRGAGFDVRMVDIVNGYWWIMAADSGGLADGQGTAQIGGVNGRTESLYRQNYIQR